MCFDNNNLNYINFNFLYLGLYYVIIKCSKEWNLNMSKKMENFFLTKICFFEMRTLFKKKKHLFKPIKYLCCRNI